MGPAATTAAFSDLPAPNFSGDVPMESLDCLPNDIAFFAPPQSSPMPDYSDLSYAASQMQVLCRACHLCLYLWRCNHNVAPLPLACIRHMLLNIAVVYSCLAMGEVVKVVRGVSGVFLIADVLQTPMVNDCRRRRSLRHRMQLPSMQVWRRTGSGGALQISWWRKHEQCWLSPASIKLWSTEQRSTSQGILSMRCYVYRLCHHLNGQDP